MSRLEQRIDRIAAALAAAGTGKGDLWGFATNEADAEALRRRAAAEGYERAMIVRWRSAGHA